jgi:PAS domain S-box-containing protein
MSVYRHMARLIDRMRDRHPPSTGARMNRSALTADSEALVFLNRNQQVQYASPEFFRQFGGSAEELCGRPFRNLVAPDLREGLESHLKQLLLGARDKYSHRTALLRRSASPLIATLTATALKGSSPNRALAIQLARPADGYASRAASRGASLSEMSVKVLEGTAAGLTSEFLAAHLFISRQAVDYHIARMLRQFGMPNRAALIALAYSTGILKTGTWPPRVADGLVK